MDLLFRTNFTEVRGLEFDGSADMRSSDCIKYRCNVSGHEWEVHLDPADRRAEWEVHLDPADRRHSGMVSAKLILVSEPQRQVQCTLIVLEELPDVLPASDLRRHFGDLWQSRRGADVTIVLDSGERFPAHKSVLAVRSLSLIFERELQSAVRIKGIEAAVFKAMLHFIYTDMVPELEEESDAAAAAAMAQHLLPAAHMYDLDRLKFICEGKLSGGIDIDTAATTLALAEEHDCSRLKAKCVDFITGSPETLDAVLATDGYRHLVERRPAVLADLLRAARERRN